MVHVPEKGWYESGQLSGAALSSLSSVSAVCVYHPDLPLGITYQQVDILQKTEGGLNLGNETGRAW